jgi:hypothetical protein
MCVLSFDGCEIPTAGAGTLVMNINDNAGRLIPGGVLDSVASVLAPAGQ